MEDSKIVTQTMANLPERPPRPEPNCCQRVMNCVADFFECDRRLWPLERPAHEEFDLQNFDESTTLRTRKYSTLPFDIKQQSEDRLDQNRLASCCTLQWWIEFLCCKTNEPQLEEQVDERTEKHMGLAEKTVEDFDNQNDKYALEVKEPSFVQANVGISKPKTADRSDDKRGKLNILMQGYQKDEQLENINLEGNSSSVSPVSTQKVEIKPFKGKGKRSQQPVRQQLEDDTLSQPKAKPSSIRVVDSSVNQPMKIYTTKKQEVPAGNLFVENRADELIFADHNPAEQAVKSSGKEKGRKTKTSGREDPISVKETGKAVAATDTSNLNTTNDSRLVLFDDQEVQPPVRDRKERSGGQDEGRKSKDRKAQRTNDEDPYIQDRAADRKAQRTNDEDPYTQDRMADRKGQKKNDDDSYTQDRMADRRQKNEEPYIQDRTVDRKGQRNNDEEFYNQDRMDDRKPQRRNDENPYNQGRMVESGLSKPVQRDLNSFRNEDPYENAQTSFVPPAKAKRNTFDQDDVQFDRPALDQQAMNDPQEESENTTNKKKKKKKNVVGGDNEKKPSQTLVVESIGDRYQQPEEIFYHDSSQPQDNIPLAKSSYVQPEQIYRQNRHDDVSPQPEPRQLSPANPMDDVKKRKKNKFVRQEEPNTDEIVVDQVTDVKKKKRNRREQKQDYVEQIELDVQPEEEFKQRKPRKKQKDVE